MGVIALAVLAVGCSSDDASPPPPPAATAAPDESGPAGPADRADPYFDLQRVLDIAIEIAPEDWDTLPGKRVPFPSELVIPPGGYLRVELDKDGWPGFALGRDEELGIWTAGGVLVAEVGWAEGEADAGASYARVPDVAGDFRTVGNPTPGTANQPVN